jgi:N-acetylglucosamine kinase-like BadF-type ATPase
MPDKYLLGVDGGNSKTDYLLCRVDGSFVDILRAPTCSHEHANVGYDGMQEKMQGQLNILLGRNGISVSDVAAAGFGLAGADVPEQLKELNKRVESIGFTKYGLANDGILGVKAIASSGVCAINGSGVVVVGIDDDDKFLQVGGIGELSGDAGGGGFIARQAILAVYKSYFRAGDKTTFAPAVFKALNIDDPYDMPTVINDMGYRLSMSKEMIRILDEAAINGDRVAGKIFDDVGINCAEGVVGCVRNLSFRDEVVVVKAGSIWNVVGYTGLVDSFVEYIEKNLAPRKVRFELLEATPALGALFWAMELYNGKVDPQYREEMRKFLSPEKYAELAGS